MTDFDDREDGSNADTRSDSTALLEPASTGRDDWSNTTPMDAGESLFGPLDYDLVS